MAGFIQANLGSGEKKFYGPFDSEAEATGWIVTEAPDLGRSWSWETLTPPALSPATINAMAADFIACFFGGPLDGQQAPWNGDPAHFVDQEGYYVQTERLGTNDIGQISYRLEWVKD